MEHCVFQPKPFYFSKKTLQREIIQKYASKDLILRKFQPIYLFNILRGLHVELMYRNGGTIPS